MNVQLVIQVKKLNQKPCVLLFRRNLVRPRARASQSYQWILQEKSHTIGLLSIQIDKYECIGYMIWSSDHWNVRTTHLGHDTINHVNK